MCNLTISQAFGIIVLITIVFLAIVIAESDGMGVE